MSNNKMIKKINLSKLKEGGNQEIDPFLEGGGKKKKVPPPPSDEEAEEASKAEEARKAEEASKAEEAESESDSGTDETESESVSSKSSDSESVVSSRSARSSTLTIDMLSGDPLFVVLSHFLMCRDEEGDNIVTVLKKISVSLEKIANAK